MRAVQLPFRLLVLSLLLLTVEVNAAQPLRALILTSPGVYHNYEYQTQALAEGIARYANVRFDVSLAELERWKTTDFSSGYDVLVYNICMADNKDAGLVANLRRQTEQLGVPALFLHCTMHSFRETEWWWPLLGLQTRAHEPLGEMTQTKLAGHAVLTGVPDGWAIASDELYINLQFDATPLLSGVGADGKTHVTTWIRDAGGTRVFGTTLGHSDTTIEDAVFQRLLANALLYVTGNLTDQGEPRAGLQPDPAREAGKLIDGQSAPQGVKFLGSSGKSCAERMMVTAAGPCYIGCILNPLEWGDETRECKQRCETSLPSPDEMINACTE